MRLDKIAAKPDRVGRYRVDFEDGSVMRLYRQTIQDYGLYAGMELTQEQKASLHSASGQMSAKMRAVRIVTASDVSRADLRQRLIQKGEDPEQAKRAVEWMEELQLVDDRRTAEQIVSRCAAKGYGIARARQALYEKRIPKEYWEDALTLYPDQSLHIRQFLRERLNSGSDERDRKRAIDALLRKGHSYGQIRSALRELDFDEFQEEWDG